MSRRALIFAPAFAPRCFSEGLVNTKLALALNDNGWEVLIVTMGGRYATLSYGKQWPAVFEKLKSLTVEVQPNDVRGFRRALDRVSQVFVAKHPVPGVRWATQASSIALREHKRKPFDLILSRSTSCVAHLPAMMFLRREKVRWIANWNDPPQHLFPLPYRHRVGRIEAALKMRYLKDAALIADVNTFPCHRLAAYMRSMLAIDTQKKIKVIPHVALSCYRLPIYTSNTGCLAFCHAGNLSTERDPRKFLAAFSWLCGRAAIYGFAFSLDIVGVIDDVVLQQIKDFGLTGNVNVSGPVEYEEALRRIRQSDVAVLIEAALSEGVFLPSKLVDYAQMGKPILAVSPATGVVSDILADQVGGVAADVESELSIRAALDILVKRLARDGSRAFDPSHIVSDADPSRVADMIGSL